MQIIIIIIVINKHSHYHSQQLLHILTIHPRLLHILKFRSM